MHQRRLCQFAVSCRAAPAARFRAEKKKGRFSPVADENRPSIRRRDLIAQKNL
jgi:hypothetical protein